MDGLVECGSPSRPVSLEVRGFASSSKFEGRDDSDGLNLKTANLRAESVVGAIERRVEAMEEARTARASLEVRPVPWSSFDSMSKAAGFNDHDSDGEYSELRGLLNRRAELSLLDPAGCEVAG